MADPDTINPSFAGGSFLLDRIPELRGGSFLPIAVGSGSDPSQTGRSLPWQASADEPASDPSPHFDDGQIDHFQPRTARGKTLLALIAVLVLVTGSAAYWPLANWRSAQANRPAPPLDRQPITPAALPQSAASHTHTQPDAPLASTEDPESSEITTSNSALRQEREARIDAVIGDVSRYRTALHESIGALPAEAESRDYQHVLDVDLLLVEQVQSWNALIDNWRQQDMRSSTPAEAAAHLAVAEPLLKAAVRHPAEEALQTRVACLRAITAREAPDGQPIAAELVEWFEGPAFGCPFLLQTKDGHRYYLPDRPRKMNDRWTGSYLADVAGEQVALDLPHAELDSEASGASPLHKIAQEVIAKLNVVHHGNWESTFVSLIRTVNSEQQLDPLARIICLRRLIGEASKGSHPLQVAFEEPLRSLNSLQLADELNWVNPKDDAARSAREALTSIEDPLADLQSYIAIAVTQHRAMKSVDNQPRFRWIGRLRLDEGGVWRCTGLASNTHSSTAGRLLVLQRSGTSDRFEFSQVGDLNNGIPQLSTNAGLTFRAGTPVWLEE